MIIASLLMAGCSKEDETVNQAAIRPMLGAVMHSRIADVRRLAEQGVGLDERGLEDNSTPMISAAQTEQWRMVEILIDHGADIWTYDEFGITAAQAAMTSRLLPGSVEDEARQRVIAKLKARGYPFPPPESDKVLRLVTEKRWPPSGVKP